MTLCTALNWFAQLIEKDFTIQVSEPQGKQMQMCFICWNECPGLFNMPGSAASLWISSGGSVPL